MPIRIINTNNNETYLEYKHNNHNMENIRIKTRLCQEEAIHIIHELEQAYNIGNNDTVSFKEAKTITQLTKELKDLKQSRKKTEEQLQRIIQEKETLQIKQLKHQQRMFHVLTSLTGKQVDILTIYNYNGTIKTYHPHKIHYKPFNNTVIIEDEPYLDLKSFTPNDMEEVEHITVTKLEKPNKYCWSSGE